MADASGSNYKIGDRITATSAELNGQLGTIKYIGALPAQKGTWYGVELDNPVGRHDGSFKNEKYFDSKPSHGVFLKETAFVPCEFDPLSYAAPEEETTAVETTATTDVTEEEPVKNEQETTETDNTSSPTEVVEQTTQAAPKDDKKPSVPASKTGVTTAKTTTGVTKPTTGTTKTGTTATTKPATGTTSTASTLKKTTKTPTVPSSTTSTTKPTTTTTTKTTAPTATSGAAVQEYKQEIDGLNLEIKRLNEELEAKDSEIEELNGRNGEFKAKMEDMEVSFRTEKETLQKKLAELQATKADELKRLDELDSEYKKKFRDTHQQLQETLKEKKELDFQVKKLQRELEASQNSEAMVENLILEKDALAERAEIAELELEEFKKQVQNLAEEKELLQLEMEEALLSQGGTDAGELRLENMRIKQALEKLHAKYETEKRESESKISDLSGRVENVPKIEEKEKLIKQLNEELKKKDGVIEDLKYRIDDASESVEMVEKLTEDLLQKDDEIIELRREIMHIKKDFETDEQLIEEQEDYLKELEKDVMNRDYEISTLKNKIEEQVTAQVESEKVLQKFKEKVKSQNEELDLMRQKMAGGDEKRLFDKIDELSHKQIELVGQIRENHKRQLAAQLDRIRATNETLKYSVLISVLPKNLKDKMHGESLNKFVQIVSLKDKINLLVREIKGKYFRDEYHANENIDFLSWLKDLLLDLADVILYCDILELKFYSFDHENEIENYVLFSKSNIFNQLLAINSIVDQLFNNIREDTLSVKYNLETLRLVIGKLNTSCQEYEDQFASIPVKLKKSIDQSIAQAYEIYAYGNNKHLKLPKTEKVITRLEEFNNKLHKNLILDENVDDKHESNFETMIGLKYSLESFAEKIKGTEPITQEELEDLESSTEHECARLTGYQVQAEDEHQALTHRGPWNQINNTLRNEIEQVSETAINFEKATSQLKEQIRANLQQQNEMKDLNNIKEALEKRVADLQLKSEKATQLEMEKKRFLEREVHFKEATEKIRHTLDNAEKKVKQLEEENAKLREKAGPGGSSQSTKPTLKSQTSGIMSQSRNSITDLSEKLVVGGVAQSDVEEYLNIISKLGEESISAKADSFKRRVKDLNTTMPAFARCMERHNVAKQHGGSSRSGASEEEKTKLGQIVNRVNEISKRTKLEICQSSVVSLQEFSGKSKFEKQQVIDEYLKNKSETSNKLKYEVLSLSNQIVNFTNKIQEQSKFKLFFEPSMIDLLQNRTGTVQNLGKLEILGPQGSSGAAQARTDEIVLNKTQLREFRQLVL